MSDAPRLRPACPDWCAADHQPEMTDADSDGYLHHSQPHHIALPGPLRPRRGLTVDLFAIQRPDAAGVPGSPGTPVGERRPDPAP